MPENRISVQAASGLLTELDMSELLGLSENVVMDYIKKGLLPGARVGSQHTRRRTLTSIRQLVEFVEEKANLQNRG